MKKLLSYLLVIALVFGMGMSFVNAEGEGNESFTGSGDAGAEATVGDVDAPVYDVEVNWYNFVFDWKYNETAHEYEWMVHQTLDCMPYTHDDLVDMGYDFDNLGEVTFYTDSSCTVVKENFGNANDTYYMLEGAGAPRAFVVIEDMSTNGYIEPSLSWSSEDQYDFTTAAITYSVDVPVCDVVPDYAYDEVTLAHISSDCTGDEIETANAPEGTVFYAYLNDVQELEYTGGEVPITAKRAASGGVLYNGVHDYYEFYLELGLDETKTITTPTPGDTIGTLTITITAH